MYLIKDLDITSKNSFIRKKTKPSQRWDFKWFHLKGIATRNYFDLLLEDGYKPTQVINPDEFNNKVERLFRISKANNVKSIVLASAIISDLISDISRSKFSDGNIDKFSDHSHKISKVIQFIEENYSKEITLSDLKRFAGLSKYHFSRIFKSHVEMSPYDYLINFRINKSKELLALMDFSVSQICNEIGFMDYNNFIRAFSKTVGILPLQYRKSGNI